MSADSFLIVVLLVVIYCVVQLFVYVDRIEKRLKHLGASNLNMDIEISRVEKLLKATRMRMDLMENHLMWFIDNYGKRDDEVKNLEAKIKQAKETQQSDLTRVRAMEEQA